MGIRSIHQCTLTSSNKSLFWGDLLLLVPFFPAKGYLKNHSRISLRKRVVSQVFKKVLIVDDNEGIRRLFTEVLINEGYSVDTATNGLQALERIRENVPSIVLLDLKMPILGGMEVLNEISNSYLDLPVIMITGYTDQKDVKVGLESGLVKHCISKPLSLTDLIELLHSLNI